MKRQPSLPELVHDTPTRPLSEVDQYCLAIIDSTRPPPMAPMMPARHALAMRLPSQSGHDLSEAALDEVREQVARVGAEQVAMANADRLRAIAERNAEWRRWWWARGGKFADGVIWVVLAAVAAFVLNVIRTGGHP